MSNFHDTLKQWEERKQRQEQASAVNRRTIFGALDALGIQQVEVMFDGCGDSGQIESIDVTGGSGELTGDVAVAFAPWGEGANSTRSCPLAEAVEELCYSLLEIEHGGWENNDGAFGTFVFDVARSEIAFEFNGRYTEYETSLHSYTEA